MHKTAGTLFLSVAAASVVAGCSSFSEGQGASAEADEFVQCTDPRPQVCTMDYLPVCGRLAGGKTKTYANGCGACADPAVDGYAPGACQAGG